MKNQYCIFLIIALFLTGCGRDESGYIKNETGKPITITLGLNNINKDPTKYLIVDALNGITSSDHKYDGIDKYFVSYDSLNTELTLKLGVHEKLKLGSLRLDMTRDSIQDWEFNSLKAIGEGVDIHVKGIEIMKYVERISNIFSQNSHVLILK